MSGSGDRPAHVAVHPIRPTGLVDRGRDAGSGGHRQDRPTPEPAHRAYREGPAARLIGQTEGDAEPSDGRCVDNAAPRADERERRDDDPLPGLEPLAADDQRLLIGEPENRRCRALRGMGGTGGHEGHDDDDPHETEAIPDL